MPDDRPFQEACLNCGDAERPETDETPWSDSGSALCPECGHVRHLCEYSSGPDVPADPSDERDNARLLRAMDLCHGSAPGQGCGLRQCAVGRPCAHADEIHDALLDAERDEHPPTCFCGSPAIETRVYHGDRASLSFCAACLPVEHPAIAAWRGELQMHALTLRLLAETLGTEEHRTLALETAAALEALTAPSGQEKSDG